MLNIPLGQPSFNGPEMGAKIARKSLLVRLKTKEGNLCTRQANFLRETKLRIEEGMGERKGLQGETFA